MLKIEKNSILGMLNAVQGMNDAMIELLESCKKCSEREVLLQANMSALKHRNAMNSFNAYADHVADLNSQESK